MTKKDSKARRSAKWLLNVAALATVMGLFVATPVSAWADDNSGSQTQQNQDNQNNNQNNQDKNKNKKSDNGTDGGTVPSPEVPYAAILPIAIIGMTIYVYRRRMKSA